RWLWQVAHRTSTRRIPRLRSSRSITASPASGVKNAGQPQCDSNFASERNSSAPHARHRYTPLVFVSVYSPVNGRSVPAWRRTWYSSGVSWARHSASDLTTFGAGSVAGSMPPDYVGSREDGGSPEGLTGGPPR